ncbi:hypothetical protein FKM82_007729 [Ascaphus truei]
MYPPPLPLTPHTAGSGGIGLYPSIPVLLCRLSPCCPPSALTASIKPAQLPGLPSLRSSSPYSPPPPVCAFVGFISEGGLP